MSVSDGRSDKSFEEKLRNPSILDQLSIPYIKGPLTTPPGPQDDPGRLRNIAFFNRMSGTVRKGGPEKVNEACMGTQNRWRFRRDHDGEWSCRQICVLYQRNLIGCLQPLKKYAIPSAGTFNCRAVKDTGNPSAHGWGVAIDINTQFADYWLWAKKGTYRNRVPFEIVDGLRTTRLHLGRSMGTFRHDALRVPAGVAVSFDSLIRSSKSQRCGMSGIAAPHVCDGGSGVGEMAEPPRRAPDLFDPS